MADDVVVLKLVGHVPHINEHKGVAKRVTTDDCGAVKTSF